jgi:hypothetical protein
MQAWGATGHAGDRDCSGSQGGHENDPAVRKSRVLAEGFGVTDQRRVTPMTPAAYGALRAARDGGIMADKERYRSGIGSPLHMAQRVRTAMLQGG